jgi:hypothetical protein
MVLFNNRKLMDKYNAFTFVKWTIIRVLMVLPLAGATI